MAWDGDGGEFGLKCQITADYTMSKRWVMISAAVCVIAFLIFLWLPSPSPVATMGDHEGPAMAQIFTLATSVVTFFTTLIGLTKVIIEMRTAARKA